MGGEGEAPDRVGEEFPLVFYNLSLLHLQPVYIYIRTTQNNAANIPKTDWKLQPYQAKNCAINCQNNKLILQENHVKHLMFRLKGFFVEGFSYPYFTHENKLFWDLKEYTPYSKLYTLYWKITFIMHVLYVNGSVHSLFWFC